MMRTLFLIRHAKSSWDSPSMRDFDRPLNGRGLKDAPKMAALLKAHSIRPDLIVSSPAKRALTTALFFADVMDIAHAEVVQEPSIYEAVPSEILRLIAQLPDTATTVFMFGHNPTFTDVANEFAQTPFFNIPTCGVVRIDTKAEKWSEMYEGNSVISAHYFPKEVL